MIPLEVGTTGAPARKGCVIKGINDISKQNSTPPLPPTHPPDARNETLSTDTDPARSAAHGTDQARVRHTSRSPAKADVFRRLRRASYHRNRLPPQADATQAQGLPPNITTVIKTTAVAACVARLLPIQKKFPCSFYNK